MAPDHKPTQLIYNEAGQASFAEFKSPLVHGDDGSNFNIRVHRIQSDVGPRDKSMGSDSAQLVDSDNDRDTAQELKIISPMKTASFGAFGEDSYNAQTARSQ